VKILEKRKSTLGEEHPYTLSSISKLASIYWHQGRQKEAEELEVEALEMAKKILGEEHPSTLITKANLVLTRQNQGQ
jgi:hypothetical protein